MFVRAAAVGALIFIASCGSLQAQTGSNWNRDGDRRGDYRDDQRWDRRDDRQGEKHDENGDVTETQKRACSPDVFRLCSLSIPNRDAITACLHNNIDKLNADCRAVMEGRLR